MSADRPPVRPTRNPVLIEASLSRVAGAPVEPVTVEDFSMGGCAVRGWFRVGDRVTLDLPRMGRFDAEVRWARRGRAGLAFRREPAR